MSVRRAIAAPAVAVTLVAVGVGVHDSTAGGKPHTVTVMMADAGPLEVGDEVRASGVQVGTISSMHLVNGQARMTLAVDPAVLPLHSDASVTVRPVNLLGEDYVDLNPGTDSKPFTDSTEIPASRSSLATTLGDVLNTFQAPTAAGLAGVVTTAGEGLSGNGESTAKTIATLAPAMVQAQQLGDLLSQQNQVLSQLVTMVDPVASALATGDGSQLDHLIGSTQQTLAALTAEQRALRATIQQLPGTLESARSTLEQFGGVADAATPTLKALRPLTSNLSQVVDEIESFTQSANPALATLQPVLDRANALLDQAAPVVAALRSDGPQLARASHSLRPVSKQLLEDHLAGVMGFVRKWALSTNGYDGLGHYFRGVVYVTPSTLRSIATSLVPNLLSATSSKSSQAGTGASPVQGLTSSLNGLLGGTTSQLTQGLDNVLPGTGSTVGGLLQGLGLGRTATGAASAQPRADATSAFGLTRQQEQAMLDQLLGGGN